MPESLERSQSATESQEHRSGLRGKASSFNRRVLSKDNKSAVMLGSASSLVGAAIGGPLGWFIGGGIGLAIGHRMDLGQRKQEDN